MPSEKRSMLSLVIAIALAACVLAVASCCMAPKPMDSTATYEFKVLTPDGWRWIEQQRVMTKHYRVTPEDDDEETTEP